MRPQRSLDLAAYAPQPAFRTDGQATPTQHLLAFIASQAGVSKVAPREVTLSRADLDALVARTALFVARHVPKHLQASLHEAWLADSTPFTSPALKAGQALLIPRKEATP